MTPQREPLSALLREREARSLILLLWIVVASYFAQAVNFWLAYLDRPAISGEPAIIGSYLAFSLVNAAVMLLLLRRRRWVEGVGLVVAFYAASFPATGALVMWLSYAAHAPAVLLTKLPVAALGLAAVAGMTLTLRPLYVVIAGAGAALSMLAFYAVAAADPETRRATDAIESYAGLGLGLTRHIVDFLLVLSGTAAAAYATHLARRTVGEAIALQRTRDLLSRYFSPEVASRIAQSGESFLYPGGREQEIAVLFADLQGFTRLCAGLPASEALALLSEYHRRMVAEIFRAGGTLDKFTGDGVMATFGTPEPVADAADRAVRCGKAMIAALVELNRVRARRGEAPLVQRIGIHAGPALVGNVGTEQRLEFTVIGDTVNVASRIERACKKTGRAALLSAAVLARLKAPLDVEALGAIELEGQPQPVELYAFREAAGPA